MKQMDPTKPIELIEPVMPFCQVDSNIKGTFG